MRRRRFQKTNDIAEVSESGANHVENYANSENWKSFVRRGVSWFRRGSRALTLIFVTQLYRGPIELAKKAHSALGDGHRGCPVKRGQPSHSTETVIQSAAYLAVT